MHFSINFVGEAFYMLLHQNQVLLYITVTITGASTPDAERKDSFAPITSLPKYQ